MRARLLPALLDLTLTSLVSVPSVTAPARVRAGVIVGEGWIDLATLWKADVT